MLSSNARQTPDLSDLESRIARLEERLAAPYSPEPRLKTPELLASGLTLGGALFLSYRGLDLPNHPYQWALGGLTAALAYHRGWFRHPKRFYGWLLAPLNALQLAMLFKLLIGSGIRHPFFWMQFPEVVSAAGGGKWYDLAPSLHLSWQATALSGWSIDLTLIQIFLLLITLIGALFRFQPFVSLTAFLLIAVSVPAFASFDWPWVFPAMTVAALSFYLQSAPSRGSKSRS